MILRYPTQDFEVKFVGEVLYVRPTEWASPGEKKRMNDYLEKLLKTEFQEVQKYTFDSGGIK